MTGAQILKNEIHLVQSLNLIKKLDCNLGDLYIGKLDSIVLQVVQVHAVRLDISHLRRDEHMRIRVVERQKSFVAETVQLPESFHPQLKLLTIRRILHLH